MKGRRILLGSGSPRRRELLASMDIDFETVKIDVDESYPADIDAFDVPQYLSELKANAYLAEMKPNDVLITADTCVIVDGKVLGKPADRAEAIEMLHRLSGRTHHVVTGVSITSCCNATGCSSESFSEITEVRFSHLSEQMIEYYVDRYHPLDKAGAYGIQEWIGMTGIKSIKGDFYNVMGLPTSELYSRLRDYINQPSQH